MKPIKFIDIENDEFNQLGIYDTYLGSEGEIYFVKDQYNQKLQAWKDSNNIISSINTQGKGLSCSSNYGTTTISSCIQEEVEVQINELKSRIEKLEEGIRKINSKNGLIFDLMGRVREINNGERVYIISQDPTKAVKIGFENRRKYNYIE